MSADEGLYGDLQCAGLSEEIARLRADLAASRSSEDKLRAELVEERAMSEHLREDKRVLSQNLSTVFSTATLEVQRKSKEIEQLRLEALTTKEQLRSARDKIREGAS